jgi:hypothetical protein
MAKIANELCNRIVDWAQDKWQHANCEAQPFACSHDFAFLFRKEELWKECYINLAPLIPNFNNHFSNIMMRVTRYQVGDFIGRHQDLGNPYRNLTVMVQLSDPSTYEGGNMSFDDARIVSNEQGDISISQPSDWHEVLPVTSGIRYSLVWWLFPSDYDHAAYMAYKRKLAGDE